VTIDAPRLLADCPICASRRICLDLEDVEDYITGEPFGLARCDECGISFTQPQPPEMDAYYPSLYRRYTPWILTVLRFLYRRRAHRWVESWPAPGRVLEIGCGDGLMLDSLRSIGWEVEGIERTDDVAAVARAKGIPVTVGAVDDLPDEPRYDIVILFQVLEHVHDPVALLRACTRRLRPGGRLIVSVPNLGSWQAEVTGSNWMHLEMPRHLVHFTPDTLDATMRRVGMRVHDVSFVSWEHDPYGWLQSGLNSLFRRKNRLLALLQRMDRPDAGDLPMAVMAVVMAPLCAVASVSSWIVGRGAILQVVCVADEPSAT